MSEQPQSKLNVPAVVSLVLGLVSFCLPLVTALLAIIFGFFGLRRSRDPNVGGRSPAIAGITLGIVSVALWGTILGTVGLTWIHSRPQMELGRQFIRDLSNRDIDSAAKLSASTMGWDRMEDLSNTLTSLGEYRDVRFNGYTYEIVNGTEQWTLTGEAYYSRDAVPVTLTTVRQEGKWRVYRVQLSKKLKPPVPGLWRPTSQPVTAPAGR